MRKLLFLFCLSFLEINAQTYHIKDFANEYSAEIVTNKDNAETQALRIIENQTQKTLIKENVRLDEYDFENTKSNIQELPYGHQSIIIYDDFNFDGQKDIAIKYGNESCYGGPSYYVFLKLKNQFVRSAEFTDLAQNYCGFFSVEKEKKQLHTMTKSGCCWHQYSDFIVKNNKPLLIHQVEESLNNSGLYFEQSIMDSKNGKQTTSYKNYLVNDEDLQDKVLVSYDLLNGKKMNLLLSDNNQIYYFLCKTDDETELIYGEKFYFSKKENSLSFGNSSAYYSIYNDRIEVLYKGKKTTISANTSTRKKNISEVYNHFKTNTIENLEVTD